MAKCDQEGIVKKVTKEKLYSGDEKKIDLNCHISTSSASHFALSC